MNESLTVTLALFGAILTWTTTVVGLVVWLNGKFRYVEKTIYREMDKHRGEDDRQFEDLRTRALRLEIKTFGYGPYEMSREQ